MATYRPDIGGLGRWLCTWVTDEGAIYGFPQHFAWGEFPGKSVSYNVRHCPLASTLTMAFAAALRQEPCAEGLSLAEHLIGYQLNCLRQDGLFGFTPGQPTTSQAPGLSPDMMVDVSLAASAWFLGDQLSAELREGIQQVVGRNLSVSDQLYEPCTRVSAKQEYGRCWAKLLHMSAFNHGTWDGQLPQMLEYLITELGEHGLPGEGEAGVRLSAQAANRLLSSEYLGVALHALTLAHQRYDTPSFLEEACAITQHVVANSWCGLEGRRHLHHSAVKLPRGEWEIIRTPSLIGGVGLTLSGLESVLRMTQNKDLNDFLNAMDHTYVSFQSFGGYFHGGVGGTTEQNIIPNVCQSHDLYHLVQRHGVGTGMDFWHRVLKEYSGCSVTLGDNYVWSETDKYWSLRTYSGMPGLRLSGQKDRPGCVGEDQNSKMPEEPRFLKTQDAIHHFGGPLDLRIVVADDHNYQGPHIQQQLSVAGLGQLRIDEDETIRCLEIQDLNVSAETKIRVLENVELFGNLTKKEIRELANSLTERPFGMGKVVIQEGEWGESMFVLVRGELEVVIRDQGNTFDIKVDKMTQPGDFMGEMSMLTGEVRRATVLTTTRALLYEISKTDMMGIIRKRPELIATLGRAIAEREMRMSRSRGWSGSGSLEPSPEKTRSLAGRIKHFFGSD